MSSQWSILSIWDQKIQITLVTANKAIVFKNHATINVWEVMRYSMIAQKVTDGCSLLKIKHSRDCDHVCRITDPCDILVSLEATSACQADMLA